MLTDYADSAERRARELFMNSLSSDQLRDFLQYHNCLLRSRDGKRLYVVSIYPRDNSLQPVLASVDVRKKGFLHPNVGKIAYCRHICILIEHPYIYRLPIGVSGKAMEWDFLYTLKRIIEDLGDDLIRHVGNELNSYSERHLPGNFTREWLSIPKKGRR